MEPNIETEKLKTLEAKNLASKVLHELKRDDLEIDDFIDLLWVCPPGHKISLEYKKLLVYKEENHNLQRDPDEIIRIKQVIYTGFKETLFGMDALSMLGGLNFDNDQRFINWNMFNPNAFTLGVEKKGKFILISGNPGSGKTHLSTLLTSNAITKGLVVLTNINFIDDNPSVKKIYSTSQLLIEGIKLNLKGVVWIAVLDESGTWQHTQEHGTTKNIEWDKLYRLIRKFGGNMLFIDQKQTGFTNTLKLFATIHIHKYNKHSMKIDIVDPALKAHHFIRGIPATDLAFDTDDIAFFIHDINMKEVLEKATAIKGSKKQKQEIISFLEQQRDSNNKRYKVTPEEVSKFLRDKSVECGKKLTYDEIAKLIDENPVTVGMWCRKK